MDLTQIEFLDIDKNEEYCYLIDKVVQKYFEVEMLKEKIFF